MGVLVLISVGEFWLAIEQLVQQHYHQRAALILAAAQQLHIIPTVSSLRAISFIMKYISSYFHLNS